MNPKISTISEEGDIMRFTLSGVDVCIANSLRRIILSEIPTVVIQTETHETNQCVIEKNTSRLHNEILKHRLSMIPICIKELDLLPGKYILELDVSNETDNMMYVTTEMFRIKNKENGNYLTKDEVSRIFPPSPITHYYIDFARLRPKIADNIPGEQIKLTADFSVGNARLNSMYNVVSKCAYGNTPNVVAIESAWTAHRDKLLSEGATKEEVEFQKTNYMLLDAQRQFVPNSFDFVIQTLGIYDNIEILNKGCQILRNKFDELIQAIDSETLVLLNSETTMDYCYDVILENEDYTVGKVLEYILYEKYYIKDKTLTFCGFKKFHPHNKDSTLRLAFAQNTDRSMVKQIMRLVCADAEALFAKIRF
jgi:DNA-directed RNA polymerase subunit L